MIDKGCYKTLDDFDSRKVECVDMQGKKLVVKILTARSKVARFGESDR